MDDCHPFAYNIQMFLGHLAQIIPFPSTFQPEISIRGLNEVENMR